MHNIKYISSKNVVNNNEHLNKHDNTERSMKTTVNSLMSSSKYFYTIVILTTNPIISP